MKKQITFLKDLLLNIFLGYKYDLFYVIEGADWVIDCEWQAVSERLNIPKTIRSKTTSTSLGLKNKIIHFGSVGTFITTKGCKKVHSSNTVILTWFHVVDEDERLKFITEINQKVSFVHTACEITRAKLIKAGLVDTKIIVIPLGVDLKSFVPASTEDKKAFRKDLGIPENVFVIGSFQKDGNGWGEGETPKLIKGPDAFCDVVEKLAEKHPLHILLTGPARGYVKNRLTELGIKYTHTYLTDLNGIVPYYQILDLYLVCSREEGGPKALLESMACGVPLISTRVGMAPELIVDGKNGYLVEIDDKINLVSKAEKILSDSSARAEMVRNGLQTIKTYNYDSLVELYWENFYSKLQK